MLLWMAWVTSFMLWPKKLKERKVYFACCFGGEGMRAEATGHVTTVGK